MVDKNHSKSIDSVYKFDFINKNLIKSAHRMNYERSNHGICYMFPYIYVVGGNKEKDETTCINKCERMNIETTKWELIADCQFKSSCCSIC